MDSILLHKPKFEKIIEHYLEEISALRTGRATPALVENVNVLAYGSTSKLKHVASISVPDSKTLQIEPWDKSIVKEVEKALVVANLGFNPINDGKVIRLIMPPLTEENRKELTRVLSQKTEASRIAMRQVRDDIKEIIVLAEKNKEMSEDDKFRTMKELDDFVNEYNQKVKQHASEKEEEILKV